MAIRPACGHSSTGVDDRPQVTESRRPGRLGDPQHMQLAAAPQGRLVTDSDGSTTFDGIIDCSNGNRFRGTAIHMSLARPALGYSRPTTVFPLIFGMLAMCFRRRD